MPPVAFMAEMGRSPSERCFSGEEGGATDPFATLPTIATEDDDDDDND